MKKTTLSSEETKLITATAKKHIYAIKTRGDLESRNSDSEDFIETSVWSLRAALEEAYRLGKESR